jgi:hypothetical protein
MENKSKTLKEELKQYENLSSNELLFYLKQFEADHEAIKIKMINDLDKLEEVERKYKRVTQILKERLEKK